MNQPEGIFMFFQFKSFKAQAAYTCMVIINIRMMAEYSIYRIIAVISVYKAV